MSLHMFDSIEYNVPGGADAIAGYVGGHWPTYFGFVNRYPHLAQQHRILSIAVTAHQHARCLDVETGDATSDQAPGWLHAYADRSYYKPVLYTSASNVGHLVSVCSNAGLARNTYLIWSAHYTFREHVCSPHTCGYPQADGTQYTDRANGLNLDESLVFDAMFPSISPPPYPLMRFPVGPFPVPKEWGRHPLLAAHTHLNEREVVTRYRFQKSHNTGGNALWVAEQELLFLRKRVWYVAHFDPRTGKKRPHPIWGENWLGWRWQELAHMTKGIKQGW